MLLSDSNVSINLETVSPQGDKVLSLERHRGYLDEEK